MLCSKIAGLGKTSFQRSAVQRRYSLETIIALQKMLENGIPESSTVAACLPCLEAISRQHETASFDSQVLSNGLHLDMHRMTSLMGRILRRLRRGYIARMFRSERSDSTDAC
jgi:hypothetical protein